MTNFRFRWFKDYEDGKMARLETAEYQMPVNIYAEPDSDFDLQEDEPCSADIIGVGSEVSFYADEEAFNKAGTGKAPVSMIPMGTFPAGPDDQTFEESPYIIFTGKVLDVEKDPEAGPDEPDYCAEVETLEMTITVFFKSDSDVLPGGILDGIAWLYGDILRI